MRQVGHRVAIHETYDGERCDMMIALHARRSAESVARLARERPAAPIVVVLTGTDLYRDIRTHRSAERSLNLATRLVVLQPHGLTELGPRWNGKARVILQSADGRRRNERLARATRRDEFRVVVLGHLRREKDPLRAALAARRLPESSRIRVIQIGSALDERFGRRARAESIRNPRYEWVGELSHVRAQRALSESDLMVLSSRMEGGANVISEAVAAGVPIVASHIPSTAAILGADFPGYFPVGDTRQLATLMRRAETDSAFYRRLRKWCDRLAPRFEPAAERDAWRRLIVELMDHSPWLART
jgi:putative glycosyltransferase (TIGR04348 family)